MADALLHCIPIFFSIIRKMQKLTYCIEIHIDDPK